MIAQDGITFTVRVCEEDLWTLAELAASVVRKAPITPQQVLTEGIFSQIRAQIPPRSIEEILLE